MKSKNILITGASGLIGQQLTPLFQNLGYSVAHLGRKKSTGPVQSYVWNIDQQQLDQEALQSNSIVIHLAGAGVADHPWTPQRKQEILTSRTRSTRLLYDSLKKGNHTIDTVICASAIGYYGFHDDPRPLHENEKPGSDFLADVVNQWEQEADAIASLGIRLVKIRIGVVLSEKAGALKEMSKPVTYFVGAPLGSGNQYISWIHIDDLCSIFAKAVEDTTMQGPYNAVAPHPVTNRILTQHIAHALGRPLWLPPIPGFVLKVLLGEMANLVLRGSNISADKILQTSFAFTFPQAAQAVQDLLKK